MNPCLTQPARQVGHPPLAAAVFSLLAGALPHREDLISERRSLSHRQRAQWGGRKMYRTGTASPLLASTARVSARPAPPGYLQARRLLHPSPHLPMQNSISFLLSRGDSTGPGDETCWRKWHCLCWKRGRDAGGGSWIKIPWQGKGSLQSWGL